jgi:Protein of unknown function (DUF3768)
LANEFTPENDPFGEHDFGSVTVARTSSFKEFQIFWKIDYFDSEEMEYGAEDPSSLQTYRLLTIMYPQDW